MWVYIEEYCLGFTLCSIMQRLTWDDLLMTPLIFINQQGTLKIINSNFKIFMPDFDIYRYVSIFNEQKI